MTKRLQAICLPTTTRVTGTFPSNTPTVISQEGLPSVPSCACVTDFACPQRTPIVMQLICTVVSPVSTCACVRLSMLLHTLVHARTFFQFVSSVMCPMCSPAAIWAQMRRQVLNSQRETLLAIRKKKNHTNTSFCRVVVFLLPPSGTTCQSAATTLVAEHAAFGKIGHWRADGVCDRNKNPEFSETDGSDEPISHSLLVHWLGPMSVKVSLTESETEVGRFCRRTNTQTRMKPRRGMTMTMILSENSSNICQWPGLTCMSERVRTTRKRVC